MQQQSPTTQSVTTCTELTPNFTVFVTMFDMKILLLTLSRNSMEDNSDEQEPHPPPSLPDSFPTSDDEINDSLWSLLTDTNFDFSVIGEDQEPEPEPPTHPSLQESDVEEDLPEPVFDVTQTKGGKKKNLIEYWMSHIQKEVHSEERKYVVHMQWMSERGCLYVCCWC